MAFLEKVGGTLAAKSRDVADKAKEMAEVNRLNGQIHSQKKIAEKVYAEVGRMVYENREEWSSIDVSSQMEQLDSIQEEIIRLQGEILRVRGARKCENCGAEIDMRMPCCPECGAVIATEVSGEELKGNQDTEQGREGQQDREQSQEYHEDTLCQGCHKKLEPEMQFCPYCGRKQK